MTRANPQSVEIPYLELAHPQAPHFTRRRRLLVWGGALIALAGSLAILFLTWRQGALDLRKRIEAAAARNGLDADLVEAVVYAESRGNPRAVSPASAYGLMQLRVPTASEVADRPVTPEELFDPVLNLELGCRYLRRMLDQHGGDVRLALMAYNAGPGSVRRWRERAADPAVILEDHAFAETRAYVRKVLRRFRDLKQ